MVSKLSDFHDCQNWLTCGLCSTHNNVDHWAIKIDVMCILCLWWIYLAGKFSPLSTHSDHPIGGASTEFHRFLLTNGTDAQCAGVNHLYLACLFCKIGNTTVSCTHNLKRRMTGCQGLSLPRVTWASWSANWMDKRILTDQWRSWRVRKILEDSRKSWIVLSYLGYFSTLWKYM